MRKPAQFEMKVVVLTELVLWFVIFCATLVT